MGSNIKFESSAFAFDFYPSEAWNFQPFQALEGLKFSRFRRVEISKQTNAKADDSNLKVCWI